MISAVIHICTLPHVGVARPDFFFSFYYYYVYRRPFVQWRTIVVTLLNGVAALNESYKPRGTCLNFVGKQSD